MRQADDIENAIRNFFLSALTSQGLKSGFTDSTHLFDAGILDSFSVLNLLSYLEKQFGIEFDSGDLDESNFATVGAICRLVRSKVDTLAGS